MAPRRFWILLSIVSLVTASLVVALHFLPKLRADWPISAIAMLLFGGLSVGIYYAGRHAVGLANRHTFTNVVMGVTFLKMIVAGGTVAAYALLAEPVGKLFVLPFFLIYFVFTIFEVFVLVKLARETRIEKTPANEAA